LRDGGHRPLFIRRGGWPRAGLDPVSEVGKRGSNACLQQRVGETIPRPDEQCRAMVGALEAGALVAGGCREPLLVRWLTVRRASRQHFAIQQGQVAEVHRPTGCVSPLVHVLSPSETSIASKSSLSISSPSSS